MSNDFSINLLRFAEKFNVEHTLLVRKISFEAFASIINMTPVDTGRARANWGCSTEGHTIFYDLNLTDKDGLTTLNSIADKVTAWNCNGSIFLTNNLPYIGALEYGHSKQAPSGMVRLTVERFRSLIIEAVK
jgi:hypothetical protein